MDDAKFNTRLTQVLIALVFLLGARLAVFAMEHDNWKGAIVSFLHLSIVAAGSYVFLRKKQAN